MKQYVYICLECRQIETGKGLPSMKDCKKGGHHRWRNIGEPGNQRYRCKRCGTTVNMKEQPMLLVGCNMEAFHDWVII